MEQHPIPRQITTFEFKLIGFMTLTQFLYLLVFIPMGFVLWKIVPIPLLNIVIAALTVGLGFALAFLPINDRPMDAWIRHLYSRLTSPTQYTYQKHNPPLYFLEHLYFVSDPHKVATHIESRDKLSQYLASTKSTTALPQQGDKQQVQTLLQTPTAQLKPDNNTQAVQQPTTVIPANAGIQNNEKIDLDPGSESGMTNNENKSPVAPQPSEPPISDLPSPISKTPPAVITQKPFFIGIIKNNKKIPLPGILIYVKDDAGHTLRLLKTNPHGVFATYSALQSGEYTFEVKDPKGGYFFDTMKLAVAQVNPNPFEFYSKEML